MKWRTKKKNSPFESEDDEDEQDKENTTYCDGEVL